MGHDTPRATENVAVATENLLTVVAVASRLNVSKSTVYNLVDSGELRSHRFGKGKIRPRGLRIPESSVYEYMRASQMAPAEPVAS